MEHTFNPRRPYAMLMKGRPEESASWQSIAVYTRQECETYRAQGWHPAKTFMDRADRARRKEG